MKTDKLNVTGIILLFVLLLVPGIILVSIGMQAAFGWEEYDLASFLIIFGGAAAYFGGFAIYKIITGSIKYKVKRFLKKRGNRADKIFVTSYAYDSIPNPMAEQYTKIVEDTIMSYLPEGLRADTLKKATLHIKCNWETSFYVKSSIECNIVVCDNLNESKKENVLFNYNYSFPHEESQFVEDNLALSTISFAERDDFAKLIKRIPVKLKNSGIVLLTQKEGNGKVQHNMGTYFRDEAHAHDFWFAQYTLNGPPVIICNFDTLKKAREAILSLSFISENKGELVSSETVDYGCYINSNQQGEVIICGHDFSKDMYDEVKLKLTNEGGTIKKATPPKEKEDAKSTISKPGQSDAEVTFVNKTSKQLAPGAVATYETYKAANANAAKKFLAAKMVSKPLYYIVVDTPEGSWGKDKDGIYKE